MVTFDSVRPIFEYSRTWDFKAYKAQQHSITTLREQMQRIGVWVNELEKMRARQPCGILEASEGRFGGEWGLGFLPGVVRRAIEKMIGEGAAGLKNAPLFGERVVGM